jgi:hypothetical protein
MELYNATFQKALEMKLTHRVTGVESTIFVCVHRHTDDDQINETLTEALADFITQIEHLGISATTFWGEVPIYLDGSEIVYRLYGENFSHLPNEEVTSLALRSLNEMFMLSLERQMLAFLSN